jgi:tRNA pseudouridine13 synthase
VVNLPEPISVPRLHDDLPGLGGRIKVEPEDFVVEEVPLYRPSGAGEHLYLWIEKRNLSGEQLLDRLSRALGVSRGDIGMAGLKDRRAVTRQFISVPRQAEARLPRVEGEGLRVLESAWHGNKLRTGHLSGNRFEILIRDARSPAPGRLPELVSRLERQGVPNAYGEQRFGIGGETLVLGLALLRGEKSERDIPPQRRRFLLRLALSSVQSLLFNRVLAERMAAGLLHVVEPGDVLQVIASGGCFVAEDVVREQARFLRREIVLTGPMFGPRMKPASGAPGARERQSLANAGLEPGHFERFPKLLPGTRRPLLVWPRDLSVETVPEGVRLRFTLEPGAYATTLLREVMGTDQPDDDSGETRS